MKITYEDKIALQNDENIPRKNKVTDEDMNEIKEVVNKNADNQIIEIEEIEELKAENERLREDIKGLPSTTVEGENIDISDSTEMRFKSLNIRGNSKQDTREGKNLINVTGTSGTKNGVTYTFNNDGTIALSGTNTLTSGYFDFYIGVISITSDETYFLSGGINNNLYVQLYNKEWTVDYYDKGSGKGISLTKGEYHVRVVMDYKHKDCNGITIKPQLELGTTKTDYEQYGVMPSIDYPSEIESSGTEGSINVEICNKNMFKFVDILKACGVTIPYSRTQNGVTVTINEDGSIKAKGTATARLSLYLVGGWQQSKIYYKMKNLNNIIASGCKTDWTKGSVLNFLSYDGTTNKSLSFQGNNIYDYDEFNITGIVIDLAAGTTVDEIVIPQIERGTKATETVEHKKQVYTIPTQQPMRSVGKVRDTFIKINGKWIERHNITRIYFEQSYRWIDDGGKISAYNLKFDIDSYKQQISNISNIWDRSGNTTNSFGLGTEFIRFNNPNKFASVQEFENYLTEKKQSGTPIYADCVLLTPLDIECTEEQSAILDEIEKVAKSYKNITHIYSTDNVGPNVEVTYFKDLEKLQEQIDEIKALLSTTQTSAMLVNNLENDLVEEV